VHITIDTSNITDADRAILALVLDGANAQAAQQAAVIQDHQERVEAYEQAKSTDDGQTATPATEPEQPKRARRTKLEMAFDAAKEAHEADPTELAALVSAAEDLKAKDPQNERLKDFNPDDYQPTPASEDAESDAADEQETSGADEFASVTVAEVTELATTLIGKDRPAMVELLKQFGARRVSEIPESDLGKFAQEIRLKLA
jgi:hypothetical protein